MTPEEQRTLAESVGWMIPDDIDPLYICSRHELAAYTAAVEAKERERCANICDNMPRYVGSKNDVVESSSNECARAIRSLK